jgi:mRNA deadenylase 3'-5' endonuclease subunit Ccr4
MSFRAATYNVLANAYIKPDRYPSVQADFLDPAWRLPALVRHLEGLDADLLCLQEVERETFAALGRRLKALGYAGHFEKKGQGKPDGCATFFRQGTFVLRRAQRLDYHDGERGAGGDSGHIALLLGVEYRGSLLGVANTHLRWDRPGTPRARQIGYAQITELLEECQRFVPPCRGWLVCGDFNRTPDGEVVTAVRKAGYEYAHADSRGVRSCVANGRARLLDYLFHSRGLRAQPVAPPALEDETALPAEGQPSDHLALLAEFDWA